MLEFPGRARPAWAVAVSAVVALEGAELGVAVARDSIGQVAAAVVALQDASGADVRNDLYGHVPALTASPAT